ncbi:DUF1329 domain-containing protein [Paraburkholderia dipogonis]|uniref:DUF1329 domain-containing protein n=1 Tax=Paraburkholderia dipogonis TaxID=1211383 RepID=UPI0038B78AE9
MNVLKAAALACALAIGSHICLAEVSADEAKELGATLTPVGAIKAASADGNIPAWTGGMTTPPPGYVRKLAPGAYIDPFKDEKPILRIDSKNMAQYADKLSAGARELLKRNPDYYLDIYPTHRTAAYPESVYEATKRNATKCKTLQGGLSLDSVCRGGIPFPIPKSGYEAMWNHLVAYQLPVSLHNSDVLIVDTAGHPYLASEVDGYMEMPFYMGDKRSDPDKYNFVDFNFTNPPRSRGEIVTYADYLDPVKQPRRAWSFDPGQRRMKLAPTFAYDTPAAPSAGTSFFDDTFLFSGAMDRFDFKLIGKKEMYVPYNTYKLAMQCVGEKALKAHTLNPSCERWELHRVWVVEATLKAGMRHAYSKRVLYLDEDNPAAGMADNYDGGGNLYRGLFVYPFQVYDASSPFGAMYSVFDFVKGNYSINVMLNPTGYYDFHPKIPDERELTPEALAGSGND